MMKIFLASDHAGYEMKNELKKYLEEFGYEVKDFGADDYNAEDDYPDFIRPAAEALAKDAENGRAILIGGSGQGEAIVANRIKGVRAAVLCAYNEDVIRLSREHNNANALSIGARFLDLNEVKSAVKIWLETPFAGGRHQRRVDKIDLQ